MPRRAELPNLLPARLDLVNYRGDTLSTRLRMQSHGEPADVTDWYFEAFIRESVDGLVLAQFSIHQTGNHNGADVSNGIIRMVLEAPSAQMLPATCVWDLQGTNASAGGVPRVRTLLRGFVYSTPDVTPSSASRWVAVPPEELSVR